MTDIFAEFEARLEAEGLGVMVFPGFPNTANMFSE